MRRMVTAGVGLAAAFAASGALMSCADDPTADDVADADADGTPKPRDATTPDSGVEGDAVDGDDATVPLVSTCGDAGTVAEAWVSDPRLCLTVFADSTTVSNPRQMAFAPNGDLFVETGGNIVTLRDANLDGFVTVDESSEYIPHFLGLTHGLAFSKDGAFLYASSATTIWRWAYTSGDRVPSGAEEVVVHDMPPGGHFSRTLVFDAQGRLYVNVGSEGDVDLEPELIALRSQVRRFTLPQALPAGGIAYESGEVYASGLRNEVGLGFDAKGRMWGVENGSDGNYMPPVSEDDPVEKLNRLDAPGSRFYGYPYCWTEYGFTGGMGLGTQWAYQTPDPKTDAWCRDPVNVQRPAAMMRGHWAPLGVTEYAGGSLPWKGDLFIASHGSSARNPAVGRVIARAHLVGDDVVSITPIIGHLVDGGLQEGTWDARPVDIRTGPDGALYFSDDNGMRIFRLGYRP